MINSSSFNRVLRNLDNRTAKWMEERTNKRNNLYIELTAPPKNATSFMTYFDIEDCFWGLGQRLY